MDTIPGEPFTGHDERHAVAFFFGTRPMSWAYMKRFFAQGGDLSALLRRVVHEPWSYFEPTRISKSNGTFTAYIGDAPADTEASFSLVPEAGGTSPQQWRVKTDPSGEFVGSLTLKDKVLPGRYVIETNVGGDDLLDVQIEVVP